MDRIILRHNRAPGDVLVMTALVRDLALTHPKRYEVIADTSFSELWQNNPHVIPGKNNRKGAAVINLSYGESIGRAGREPIHFLTGFHHDFWKKTRVDVPLLYPKPDLHLSDAEKNTRYVSGRYWVLLAGGKTDFTTKHYVYQRHQQVVDALRGLGLGVVQLGGRGSRPGHVHPKIDGTLDLIGQTTTREMLSVIANAEGVICTITFAMHVAAALDKPCVVTAGGREEWWWEAYARDNPAFSKVPNPVKVSHRYLHTLGRLDCCSRKGCWKNKVQQSESDKSYCGKPVTAEGGQVVPRCMDMITAEKIVESVLSYYLDGTLQPTEGMMLPTADQPTVVTTPTGRRLVLTVAPDTALPTVPAAPVPAPIPTLAVAPTGGAAPAPPKPAAKTDGPIVDSPEIGGRVTACVLCYGDYADMHRRCLTGIQKTTRVDKLDLRVYANAVCPATRRLCDDMHASGTISTLYTSDENVRKYPAMRKLFHDPDNPITTKWTVWFDDDSMCDVDPQWFDKMVTALHAAVAKDPTVGMMGARYFFKMSPKQADWVKQASWYTGRPFRDKSGTESPNGDKIHFLTGGFWVLRTDLIAKCNIPDPRLNHNGGDVCIGEQLWQQGINIKHWNGDKKMVLWSSRPRRGLSEPVFGI